MPKPVAPETVSTTAVDLPLLTPEQIMAGATGEPTAAVETPVAEPVVAPAAVAGSPVVDWMRRQGFELPDDATEDVVADLLDQTSATNELVARHLGQFDEARLQHLADLEARVAPKLTAFQKWEQEQAEAASRQQQAAPETPAGTASRRWTPLKPVAEYEFGLLTVDANGLYAPKSPQYTEIAERANAIARRDREMRFAMAQDPDAFFDQVKSPAILAMEKRLAEFEAQAKQNTQLTQQQQEWNSFWQQNGKELSRFDVTTGEWVPTAAGELFQTKLGEFTKRGIADKDARELALDFAKSLAAATDPDAPATAGGTAPAPQQKPALPFHRRVPRAVRPTDQPSRVPAAVPTQEIPYDPALGIEGIFDRAFENAGGRSLGK